MKSFHKSVKYDIETYLTIIITLQYNLSRQIKYISQLKDALYVHTVDTNKNKS